MALNTLEDLRTSLRQTILFRKSGAIANVATTQWHATSAAMAGMPAQAATVAATANGAVPVAGDTGYPTIANFSGTGRLVGVEYSSPVPTRIMVYDRLFHCGEYSFLNANTTLTSQPSFSGRLPGGNYDGIMLLVEAVSTLGSGTSSTLTITYTDQSGNTGHTATLVVGGTGFTTGQWRMFRVPLQSGDTGVQKIESVVSTGTQNTNFNVVIARPLWFGRYDTYMSPRLDPLDVLGAPIVYPTSALGIMFSPDSTQGAIAGHEVALEIASA